MSIQSATGLDQCGASFTDGHVVPVQVWWLLCAHRPWTVTFTEDGSGPLSVSEPVPQGSDRTCHYTNILYIPELGICAPMI